MTARRKRSPASADGVYHVTEHDATFGLRDDLDTYRKSPSIYSKWYNSANDETSARYLMRIARLARRPDGLLLEGGWGRILRAAGNHSRTFRGFLCNDKGRAASVAEIAADILFCEEDQAATILDSLVEIGLIEKVPEPDWEAREAELNEKARQAREAKTGGKGKTKTGRKKSVSRKNLENSGKPPAPSKKQSEVTGEPKGEGKENGLAKGKGEAQGHSPVIPDTTPSEDQKPERPHEVTEGRPRHSAASGRREPATAAHGVSGGPKILPLRQDRDATAIGSELPRAVDGLTHGYALQADDFAEEILSLLGAPFASDSRDAKREAGNYRAALLDAIDAGLSPPQIEEVMGKARADAAAIGKHRKRYYRSDGSPEQYWRFRFNKHLNARRRLPAAAERKVGVAG
jgi:DNA endonuclease activator SAE2/CtIP C-terminus